MTESAAPTRLVVPTSLHELIDSLRKALREELSWRHTSTSGRPLSVPLQNGKVQGRFGRQQRMTFQSPLTPLHHHIHDTQGELVVDGQTHQCVILGLSVDQLTLSFSGSLNDTIPQARLTFNRMRLLLALDKRLSAIQANPQEYATLLAMKCFQPEACPTAINQDLRIAHDPTLNSEQFEALLRTVYHDLSFIWGPPGTGKTMVIGAGTQLALERGQRVLIAANTNTAVDQALGAVLARLPHPPEGSIIRYGLDSEDAPEQIRPVTLEHLSEGTLKNLETQLKHLQSEEAVLTAATHYTERHLSALRTLSDIETRIAVTAKTQDDYQQRLIHHRAQHAQLTTTHTRLQAALSASLSASIWTRWLHNDPITLQTELLSNNHAIRHSQRSITYSEERLVDIEQERANLMAQHRTVMAALPLPSTSHTIQELERRLLSKHTQLRDVQQHIALCQRDIVSIEQTLIHSAQIVATTLTRTYSAPILETERFDVVIIDEGSMASPPALFAALCLAKKQVIVVGDFLQLPPITEATSAFAKQWLATDIYQLAGITGTHDPRVIALRTQYRMHPDIAAVPTQLYQRSGLNYCTHADIQSARQPIVDHGPVPGKALAFIDTQDQPSWVEKDAKGSPCNRVHAVMAVRLAKEALATSLRPLPSISIISPYRHQVRVIRDLLIEDHLSELVQVGTIHSYQGCQSDIVIFDTTVLGNLMLSMLGHFSTNNSTAKLLNVAFTRAKCKLLIIGHQTSITTLKNDPDSLLWDAFQLAQLTDSVVPSLTFTEMSLSRTVQTHIPLSREQSLPISAHGTPQAEQALPPRKRASFYLIRRTSIES